MRRLVLSVTLAAVVAVSTAAVTLSGPATAASPTRAVPCVGQPQVRPAKWVLACGDGNAYLTGLHWVRWSSSVGVARGTEHLNDCVPDCARGTFHATPAVLVFSDPVATKAHGTLFSVLTVLADTRLPGSGGATFTQGLPLQPVQG